MLIWSYTVRLCPKALFPWRASYKCVSDLVHFRAVSTFVYLTVGMHVCQEKVNYVMGSFNSTHSLSKLLFSAHLLHPRFVVY